MNPKTEARGLGLPQPTCVTLGKPLAPAESVFSSIKWGEPLLHGAVERMESQAEWGCFKPSRFVLLFQRQGIVCTA